MLPLSGNVANPINIPVTDAVAALNHIFNFYSIPEHIRRVVEQYAVLTNVQPSVYMDAQRDTRLRVPKESYPLEKAVFVPRELVNKRGCGTLRITKEDVKRYSQQQSEQLCHKPPGKHAVTNGY